MAERIDLERLRAAADEGFAGLTADEAMKRRILSAARPKARPAARRYVPAVSAALAVLLGAAVLQSRPGRLQTAAAPLAGTGAPQPAAGNGPVPEEILADEESSADSNRGGAESAGAVAKGAAFEEDTAFEEEAAFEEELLPDAEESANEAASGAAEAGLPVLYAMSAGAASGGAEGTAMADLSGAAIRGRSVREGSLFAGGDGEIPLVALGGAVYRLLEEPAVLSPSLLGPAVGRVALVTENPSLAEPEALAAGLSDCCAEGSEIREVRGLSSGTAVACETGGAMRLFQRVSYAGIGSVPASLEDSLSVRGQVKEIALSGRGVLTGEAAEQAARLLLDTAEFVSRDAEEGPGVLTFVLKSGLRLQMSVDGDCLVACGAFRCPAFFELFD